QGGTNINTGLQAAVAQLQGAGTLMKHILLVSDGWTQQSDFGALLAQMKEGGITLSVVGAGEGPGDVLRRLAEQGGGRYYVAQDVNSVPDDFLKETVRLVGSFYVEK